jgi:membrane-associated phospholipid phosphatase
VVPGRSSAATATVPRGGSAGARLATSRDLRVLGAAGAAVGASYAALTSPRAQRYDRRAGLVLARPLGPVADRVVSAGTDLGSVYAIAGIAGALAATGRRRAALDVVVAGSLAWTAAQAVKPLVDRPRPYQAAGAFRLVAEPAGTSWPSGHVAVAAGMAGALAPGMDRRGRSVVAALAGFVALSRIYVGVHYLTDVVAGIGIGVASARTWRLLRRPVQYRRARRAPGPGPGGTTSFPARIRGRRDIVPRRTRR